MKPISMTFAGLLLVATATQALADDFRGTRGARVNQVDANVFEVIAKSSRGSDFWCGASEYARRVLGAGWNDRVYVARELGPSVTTNRRSAVHFTTNPGAAGITTGARSLSINNFLVGDSMTIQQANTHCNMFPVRP